MKLVVFGASGNCGAFFVQKAHAKGHRVTAVAREQTKYEPPAGVTVLRGDVLDTAFVAQAVRGCDAVVSGVGMRYKHPFSKRESPDDFTSRATKNIIAGMKAAGITRVQIISAGGAGDSYATLNWPMRIMLAVSNLRVAYADINVAEAALRESGLDWQAVRPVTLTHAAGTGEIRVVDRYKASSTIAREDVATYMLRELEQPAFSARTPMITTR